MRSAQIIITFILVCFTLVLNAQTENNSTVLDWRQHNLNKYNRMLVNPAYSVAREEVRAISFWSRIQWTGVNNSPQTFLLNYSGKIGPSSGGGLGLYQQNLGLLTDSGILINYSYEVKFSSNARLTLGINSTLFRRGLNKNAVTSAVPDPTVLENQDDFLWLFMPGLNLSLGAFDLGVYAENLFDYNLNESRTVTGFDSKIYSGQLGYTHTFKSGYGVLGGAVWRNLAYVKTLPNDETQYGGSSMVDLSRFGWLQAGYNNVYGVNGSLGVKLGDGMSVGVVYERGTNLSGQNFGPTYEAIATIELGNGNSNGKRSFITLEEQPELKPQPRKKTARTTEKQESEPEEKPAAEMMVRSGAYAVYGSTGKSSGQGPQPGDTDKELGGRQSPISKGVNTVRQENHLQDPTPEKIVSVKPAPGAVVDSRSTEVAISEESSGPSVKVKSPDAGNEALKITPEQPVNSSELMGNSKGYRTMEAANGVEKGFYLVVNVFSEARYFKDFIRKLEGKGFEPQYFVHPKSKFWYVYLAHEDNYYRVKQLHRSHMNGTYRGDKWILWIK